MLTRIHFTLLRIFIFTFAFMQLGCSHFYPPAPTLPVEQPALCEQDGVIIDVSDPDSALCGLARRKVQMFMLYVAPRVPEADVTRLRGFIISLADPSKQQTTFYSEFWKKQVGGETWCQFKRIKVATFFASIPHELTHAAENCPRLEDEPDIELALHPNWERRGIPALVTEADNK